MTIVDPTYSLREVPEEIPPGGGREAGGSAELGASLPARRSGHPPSWAAPFPLGAGRKRLPPASPIARARRRGLKERGRGSRGGGVVQAGRKREGRRGGSRSRGCTRAEGNQNGLTHLGDQERVRGGLPKGEGGIRSLSWPATLHEAQGCGQLRRPTHGVWEPECEEEPSGRAGGWDQGRAPGAARTTPSGPGLQRGCLPGLGDRARGQLMATGVAKEG